MGGLSTTFDVGGAISGGLGFIGNLIGSHSAYKQNKALMEQQNEYNVAMQNAQNEWSENMWNKYNEYNTPSNQVSRLREAGLNPYLAMSNGDTGNATSTAEGTPPQPAAEAPQSPWNTLGDSIMQAVSTFDVLSKNAMMRVGVQDQHDLDNEELIRRQNENTMFDLRRESSYWELEKLKNDVELGDLAKTLQKDTLKADIMAAKSSARYMAAKAINEELGTALAKVGVKYAEPNALMALSLGLADLRNKNQLTEESVARTASIYFDLKQAKAMAPYLLEITKKNAYSSDLDYKMKSFWYAYDYGDISPFSNSELSRLKSTFEYFKKNPKIAELVRDSHYHNNGDDLFNSFLKALAGGLGKGVVNSFK